MIGPFAERPAEEASDAEDVVRRLCSSCGFVVEVYWSGSRRILAGAPVIVIPADRRQSQHKKVKGEISQRTSNIRESFKTLSGNANDNR